MEDKEVNRWSLDYLSHRKGEKIFLRTFDLQSQKKTLKKIMRGRQPGKHTRWQEPTSLEPTDPRTEEHLLFQWKEENNFKKQW